MLLVPPLCACVCSIFGCVVSFCSTCFIEFAFHLFTLFFKIVMHCFLSHLRAVCAMLTTFGLHPNKAKTVLNQIRYYLKLWPGQILEINMKEKMSSMISVCILINITSLLARQIIPGLSVHLTLCPTAGMLCLPPQLGSFLIAPKGRILIEINCIPWKPGSHLPVWALATQLAPESISLTWVRCCQGAGRESWNQAQSGVTVMQQEK